jgi:MinD-like ATPase involved in chromosome partitioning or flagellar assembly
VRTLTIGVTASRFEDCKRGIAANYAANHAAGRAKRAGEGNVSVCVVDADPRSCDVGTRLGVSGTSLQRFGMSPSARAAAPLPRLVYPPLTVLPAEPAYVDLEYRQAYEGALGAVQGAYDVLFVDLPVGTGRPGPTLDARLTDHLDVLLIAVTPHRAAIAATLRHLELIDEARERGSLDPALPVGVVITGDEGSSVLDAAETAELIGDAVVGVVMQLWGRALPNFGFGPTLGIGGLTEQFDAVHAAVCARAAASTRF